MRSITCIPLSICLACIVAGCAPLSTTNGSGGASPTATAVIAAPTFAPLPTVASDVAQHIARITMTDPLNGWALTDPTTGPSAAGLDVDAHSRLLATSDGGQHWSDVTPAFKPPTLANQLAISFAARPHGRAIFEVQQPGSRADTFFYTTDAGRTWQLLNWADEGAGTLAGLTFIDDQTAFAVARYVDINGSDFVSVVETDDFFHTIQGVPTGSADPDFFRGSKVGLSFSDANTVWAATPFPTSFSTALHRSQDRGKTWQTITTVPFPTNGTGQTTPTRFPLLNAPVWTDAHTGIIRAEFGDGTPRLFVTTNGGSTWAAAPNSLSSAFAVRQFIAVDATHWWLVPMVGGDIYLTADGGAHWTPVKLGPFAYSSIAWLDAIDALHGWAVTSEGLWATTDGGHNWSLIHL